VEGGVRVQERDVREVRESVWVPENETQELLMSLPPDPPTTTVSAVFGERISWGQPTTPVMICSQLTALSSRSHSLTTVHESRRLPSLFQAGMIVHGMMVSGWSRSTETTFTLWDRFMGRSRSDGDHDYHHHTIFSPKAFARSVGVVVLDEWWMMNVRTNVACLVR